MDEVVKQEEEQAKDTKVPWHKVWKHYVPDAEQWARWQWICDNEAGYF